MNPLPPLLAAVVLLSIATPASAQSSAADRRPVARPVPAAPMPAKSSRLSPRQQALLRSAGLTLEAAPTPQGPIRLTVRNPVTDAGSLDFFTLATYSPASGEQGRAQLQPNPERSDQSWVQISFRAERERRYIVDCKVSGAARYRFVDQRGQGATRTRDISIVPLSNGQVGIVLPPSDSSGPRNLFLMGLDRAWNFQGCDIVAVG